MNLQYYCCITDFFFFNWMWKIESKFSFKYSLNFRRLSALIVGEIVKVK